MGYLFASKEAIWQAAIDKRRILLVLGLCTYGLVAMDRNGVFPFMGEAFRNYIAVQYMYGAVIIANLWFWMLGLIGYAGRYLNKPSRLLTYANEAVLPWYIFHQTLIIVIAFNLRRVEYFSVDCANLLSAFRRNSTCELFALFVWPKAK
jgi:glucan biosynthesis protein C